MERTKVSGKEEPGEYNVTLHYNASIEDIARIVDASNECRQFIKWECRSAMIKHPQDPSLMTTFWSNR